ncbi:hypothetical protein ACFE04_021269 [Oxalis oulophora]
MEYASNGEVFERICNVGRFSEDEVFTSLNTFDILHLFLSSSCNNKMKLQLETNPHSHRQTSTNLEARAKWSNCVLPTPKSDASLVNYAKHINDFLRRTTNMQMWLRIPLIETEKHPSHPHTAHRVLVAKLTIYPNTALCTSILDSDMEVAVRADQKSYSYTQKHETRKHEHLGGARACMIPGLVQCRAPGKERVRLVRTLRYQIATTS